MAALNTAITPAPKVNATSKAGTPSTTYTGNVTASLDANPTGATLSGTLTVAAVAGQATFSNLKLNRSGKGFKIKVTASNFRSKTSAAFDIPTQLEFGAMPSGVRPNVVMNPIFVTVKDSAGNTDTGYDGNVSIDKYSGPGSLSGTLTVTAVGGIATFSNLTIDTVGSYLLQASAEEVAHAYKPAGDVSSTLTVASFTHTLTAPDISGDFGLSAGSAYGFDGLSGSISPATFSGSTINALYAKVAGGALPAGTCFEVLGSHPQAFLTQIVSGATTLLGSSATYTNFGSFTRWQWASPTNTFTPGGSFPVSIS